MSAKSTLTSISRNRLTLPPPPRLWGGKMMPRRIVALVALGLLLATVAGLSGAGGAAAQGRDYDRDGDGLIEVRNLAQLNAIRWDLDGNGEIDSAVSAEDAANYNRAFPGRNAAAPNINGCNGGPTEDSCTGYELTASLDFDENGDGALGPRGDSTYWNDGKGWVAIGQDPDYSPDAAAGAFTATFEGNGNTISNLYINRHIDSNPDDANVGLFGDSVRGKFKNVGLVNPYISITVSGTSGTSPNQREGIAGRNAVTRIGGLVGRITGSASEITGSWVDGGGITFTQGEGTHSEVIVGCLVGLSTNRFASGNRTAISASDAACALHVTSELNHYYAPGAVIGGPGISRGISLADIDTNSVEAGGLAGTAYATSITASYSRGNVTCRGTGNKSCAGLVSLSGIGNIDSSYATGNVVNEAYFQPTIQVIDVDPYSDQCDYIYSKMFTAGLTGTHTWDNVIASYSTGVVDSAMEGATCTDGRTGTGTRKYNGLGVNAGGTIQGNSYWDTQTSGLTVGDGVGRTTAQLQTPTDYTGIYAGWNRDLDGDGDVDDPWDFGTSAQYPILKYGRDEQRIARQREPQPTVTKYEPPVEEPEEPGEYVAPPIVYNLNIRFSVKGITLDEGESATYQVRMSQSPVGHPAKVRIHSNNPDVVVSPTELTFSSANFRQWQTVKVTTLRDANDTDESASLAHRGPNLGYGAIIVTVNDTWPSAATETVNGHTLTLRHTLDAPYGVTVTAPATLDADADITIAGPPSDTPDGAPGYGLGETAAARMLADIRVQGTPTDGLAICLPISAALLTEAGDRPLTLLRYANGGWAPVAGAARRDDADGKAQVCADGVRQYGVFAAAYRMPDALGLAANLAAASGGAGRIVLTWTPAANATVHFVFGIKKSDADARDFSSLAAWGFSDRLNVHTVSGLESGATYYFTVIGGRARPNGSDEWGAWAPLLTATAE